MARQAPNPIDVQEFQFKLHCRLKIFENEANSTFNQPCNLVSVASRYGLIFVGSMSPTFQIIQISTIEKHILKESSSSDYSCRTINLPSPPKYLDVNCDDTKLAVVVEKNGFLVALIFDVLSMLKLNIPPPIEVLLSRTGNVNVTQTNWNPAIPNIFTVCKDDGTLGLYELKDNGTEINELPGESQAICFCWSPKGKQIAVGARNGTITQYKPDLKAVKIINAPPIEGAPSVVALQWISNYLFIAVYKSQYGDSSASLLTVEAPKVGNTIYTNYEDICYSYGNVRPVQFYMMFQSSWNTLMVASSNSMEVGVLGSENEQWTQWILPDSARAELPLSASKQETVPIGLAFDTAAVDPIIWGETSLPPAPFLLLLSHHGLLCCFRAINMKTTIPSICHPPAPLADTSGLIHFKNVFNESQAAAVVPQHKEINLTASSIEQHGSAFQAPEKANFPQAPLFNTTATSLFQSQSQSHISMPKSESENVFKAPPNLFNLPSQPFAVQPLQKPFDLTKSQQPLTQKSDLSVEQFKLQPSQKQFDLTKSQQLLMQKSDLSAEQFKLQPTTPKPGTQNFSKPFNIADQQPTTFTPSKSQHATVITAEVTKPQTDKQFTLPSSITITPIPKFDSQTEIASTVLPPTTESSIAQEEADVLISKLVREECEILEIELLALLQKGLSLKVDIGTDEEAVKLVRGINELTDFLTEITETNSGQSAEVHSLKQGLIQAWTWYEEARSRYAQTQDTTLETLLRIQKLDPVSQRYLNEMKHVTYYLESQLMQATRSLDEQWENFQDACKKVSRLKIPTMEAIYQTMVRQSAIYQKQTYILKDISRRIRSNSSKVGGTSLLISLHNADNLEKELKRLQLEPECWLQARYEKVLENKKKLTSSKIQKLNDLFLNREITKVSVSKPQLFNNSLQVKLQKCLKSKNVDSPVVECGLSPISTNKHIDPRTVHFTATSSTENLPTVNLSKLPMSSTPLQVQNQVKPEQQLSFKFGSATNTTVSNTKTSQPKFSFSQTSENAPTMFTDAPFTQSKVPVDVAQKNVPINTSSFESMKLPYSLGTSTTSVTSNVISDQLVNSKTLPSTMASAFAPTTQISFNFNSKTPASTNIFTSSTSTPFTFEGKTTPTVSVVPNTTSVVVLSSVKSPISVEAKNPEVTTTVSTPTSLFKFTSETTSSNNAPVFPSFGSNFSAAPVKTAGHTAPLNLETNENSSFSTPKSSFSFVNPTKAVASSTPEVVNKNSPIVSPSTASFNFGNLQKVIPTSTVDTKSSGSLLGTTTTSSVPKSNEKTKTNIFGSPAEVTTASTDSSSISTFKFISGTTSGSLFGGTATTPTTQTASFFGGISTGTSIFNSTVPATSTNESIVQASSATTFDNSSSSIFGSAPVTTSSSLSAVISTSSSLFGATPTSSVFSASIEKVKTTPAVESAPPQVQSTATTTPSLLTSTLTTSNTATKQLEQNTAAAVFNNPVEAATQPINNPISTATPNTLFKSSPISIPTFNPSTPTSGSLFGISTSGSFFNTTTATSMGSSTSAPVFGSSMNSTSSSPFAQPPTNTNSLFGANTMNTSSGIFGSAAPATTNNSFGFGNTTPITTSASLFGQSNAFQTGSLFSTPSTNSFGGAAFGGNKSIFGSPNSAVNESKPNSSFSFATASANTASNTPAFGSSGQSVFGFGSQPANNETASFGFGNLNVQTSTTASNAPFGSGFGQATNSNPFGKTAPEKSAFGGGSLFAKATTTSSSSIFGGGTNSSFGSGSVFGSSSGFSAPPAFGQQPGFGQNTFGGGFGSPTQASPFSNNQSSAQAGPFTGGNQSVAQTGFGGFGQAQKTSAFGSAPVFGGSPGGFGLPATFSGGSSAFGNSSFGSPQKSFGEPVTPTSAFNVGNQQENSTFANLANQNTLGFGSLAQQSQTNPAMSSFSGGSSFSTWR